MGAAGMEFSAMTTAEGLSLHDTKKRRRKSLSRNTPRQSSLYLWQTALRRLPVCSVISSAAAWAAGRFTPIGFRTGAWSAGILSLVLAVCTAAVSWARFRWELTDDRLNVTQGVIIRREISLRRSSILSAQIKRIPLSALFGSVYLVLHTADRTDRSPLRLILRQQQAVMLSSALLPATKGRSHAWKTDRKGLWLTAFSGEGLAAFFSAAALAVSVLRDIPELFPAMDAVTFIRNVLLPVAAGSPPVIWLFKVMHTRLTFSAMTFTRTGKTLSLERGRISSRSVRVRIKDVSGFDIRFSLPALLCSRQSCSLLLRGGQQYPLLSPVDERRLRIETAVISPHSMKVCSVLPMASPLAYAGARWAVCLAVLPLGTLLRRLVSVSETAVRTVCVIAAILLVWRALTTTICAQRAGLRLYADSLEITGVRWLTIHTLRVFRPSVGMIRITQGPLSRLAGVCTVKVTPRGKACSLRCIKLPFERAEAACMRMM